MNTQYVNASTVSGWNTNATDYWNTSFFAAHFPNGATVSTERRGLSAKQAAARRGVVWSVYTLIELWNSLDIPAQAGTYFIELCADQPSTVYQARRTPAATLVPAGA